MDGMTFDRLTRAVGMDSSRRRMLGALAGLGLGGVLGALDVDDTGAEKPRDRLRNRTKRHRRKRRNEKRRNKNKGAGGNGGGGLGGDRCVANGGDCNQASDCCSNNCFNRGCTETVQSCGTTTCRPAANGCADDTCCYGLAVCDGVCCDAPANQCNPQGECCAPNCSGRQCGADGCGGGGTCGTCPKGSTCNEGTGQCQGTCTPQCQGKECGPDGCGGTCGACPNGSTCNKGTGQCQSACVPQCAGKNCGPDGCGGTCGTCTDGYCQGGTCQPCDVCPTCRYPTIQAAVTDGAGPEILRICPGTYAEAINITRDVFLLGAGQGNGPDDTIISPTEQSAAIFIGVGIGAVELEGLRITGGNQGIHHSGSQLTVTNCTITGITNNFGGPAVASFGPMYMENCTISDNHAEGDAGMSGGAFYVAGELTLRDSLVTQNTANGASSSTYGGGIFVAIGGALTLDNTRVTRNATNGAGGGIFVSDDATASLTNGATVTRNNPNNCAGVPTDGCSG